MLNVITDLVDMQRIRAFAPLAFYFLIVATK